MAGKTKILVLGGKEFEVGPFVLGQVEVITPIVWKVIKAVGLRGALQEGGKPPNIGEIFLAFEVTPELISEMCTAVAAALPKDGSGKRPSLDMVKNMEATFPELVSAMFVLSVLCGFAKKEGEGDSPGEMRAGSQ